MSARRNPLYTGLLVAGVAVALSGCAVLRIDVDVYKGPLANEETVQMEQFAAMAIGAKPLLIALRDRLQWPKDADRACARGRAWYTGRFFPKPLFTEGISKSDAEERPPGCHYGEPVPWNESAGRVNAVLSLYEDLINETGLGKFLAIGKIEFEKYQSAVAVLKPDADTDKAFWESIKGGFKKSFPTVASELKKALKGLLHPDPAPEPKRIIKGVFKAFEAAAEAAAKTTSKISAARKGNFGTYEEWEELGRVEEFDLLRWPENLDGIASLLFEKKDGKEAQKFKRRVEELAGAYFEAREAMQSMALNGLSALKFLNSTDYRGEDPSALSSIAVDIQLELMQPQHIALAIHLPFHEDVTRDKYPALFELRAMLTEGQGETFWQEESFACDTDTGNCWTGKRFADAKRIIGRALFLDPVKGVDLLLQADRILKGKPPGKASRNWKAPRNWTVEWLDLANKLKDLAKRLGVAGPCLDSEPDTRNLPNCQSIKELEQFGLARGPTLKANEQEKIRKKFRQGSVRFAARAAVGFEGGRLSQGIETLISEYLEETALHPLAGTEDETAGERERAKVRLSDALVRFAEKVLFIANNDKLLSENLEGIDRYVLVLQAVGNSILIQADELRNRAEHGRKLKDRGPGELRALADALSRSNHKILDELAADLRDRLKRAKQQLSAAKARKDKAEKQQAHAENAAKDPPDIADRTAVVSDPDDLDKFRNEINSLVQIRDAVRWLTAGAAPAPFGADKAALRQAVVDKAPDDQPEVITAKDATAEMVGWLKNTVKGLPTILRTRPRALILKNVQAYLVDQAEPTIAVAKIEKGKGGAVFDKIVNIFKDGKLDHGAKDAIRARKASIDGILASASQAAAQADGRHTKLNDAIAALSQSRRAILRQAAEDGVQGDSEALRRVIQEVLFAEEQAAIARKLAASSNQEEANRHKALADRFGHAMDIVKNQAMPELPGQISFSMPGKARDARDVLDDVIALLRYEHIQAVRRRGKDHEDAKRFAEALQVAYDQRAGMAYIRPAGAYLRSSYPATSLQDDPGLGWRNMLGRHGLRTAPIIGPLYNLVTAENTRAEITAEIDKQFWQTINSVRVAGAGNTNYVIAKDDIGNWYVKKYSADPEPILKSAKSLALFGMGGQFDPDLAAQALEKDGLSKLDESARVPTPPALQSAYTVQRDTYAKATVSVYEALRALLKAPKTSEPYTIIKDSWEKNDETKGFKEDLLIALDLAVREDLQPASEELEEFEAKKAEKAEKDAKAKEDTSGVEHAQQILKALTRIKMFQETLQSNIQDQNIVAKAERKLKALEKSQREAKGEWEAAEMKRNAAEEKLKATTEDPKPADQVAELEKLDQDAMDKREKFDSLSKEVDKATETVEKAKLTVPNAIKIAENIVRRSLLKKIKSRLDAVNAYEQRILVLGEMNPQ